MDTLRELAKARTHTGKEAPKWINNTETEPKMTNIRMKLGGIEQLNI